MKISKIMKKKTVTVNEELVCTFCEKEFKRASTLLNHTCEKKIRWLNKDLPSNRIGYHAWLEFYRRNTNRKQRSYEEFIKSSYYKVFVQFGIYCSDIKAVNVGRYVDWLLTNQTKIQAWTADSTYNKFLMHFLLIEDPYDAVHRSSEYCIDLAKKESIQPIDCLRKLNPNKLCYAISNGKISPWILYQSSSGTQFLDTLNPESVKMIIEYIDPEKWAKKFAENKIVTSKIKQLLHDIGY